MGSRAPASAADGGADAPRPRSALDPGCSGVAARRMPLHPWCCAILRAEAAAERLGPLRSLGSLRVARVGSLDGCSGSFEARVARALGCSSARRTTRVARVARPLSLGRRTTGAWPGRRLWPWPRAGARALVVGVGGPSRPRAPGSRPTGPRLHRCHGPAAPAWTTGLALAPAARPSDLGPGPGPRPWTLDPGPCARTRTLDPGPRPRIPGPGIPARMPGRRRWASAGPRVRVIDIARGAPELGRAGRPTTKVPGMPEMVEPQVQLIA